MKSTHFLLQQKTLYQSTLLWALMLSIATVTLGANTTVIAQTRYTTTAAQKAQAQAVATSQGIPEANLLPKAPERYTVKRHDTLWDISKMYLKSPWQWPFLWGMNKTQIINPHLIYPGQVLVLTRSNGFARLGLADGTDGLPEDKLSPKIRSEPYVSEPIVSINLGAMRSFLSQPLIADETNLKKSGYVLSGTESRVFTGVGDSFYARNLANSPDGRYQLYRPGKPLRNPDTNEVMAYEAHYVGQAMMQREGDPAKLKITHSVEELSNGDRVMPYVSESNLNAVPHAPDTPIKARVMSSYDGVAYAGSNMIISINKGKNDGLEVGHVLQLWRTGQTMVDKEATPPSKTVWQQFNKKEATVRLPDETYGHVIVFRVFEKVAYALVAGTREPVKVGDTLTQPTAD
jgi:LysM repeat protein